MFNIGSKMNYWPKTIAPKSHFVCHRINKLFIVLDTNNFDPKKNYWPRTIYFWDWGLNGGQEGAICSSVWAKGDVRTFWGWATAKCFTDDDIMELNLSSSAASEARLPLLEAAAADSMPPVCSAPLTEGCLQKKKKKM